MEIYPAIDLYQNQCVRLSQGSFSKISYYEKDPLKQVNLFREFGIQQLHIVDLEGAKAGQPQQQQIITAIAEKFPDIKIQVGGGIRTEQDINFYLQNGIERVIVGSFAVKNPFMFVDWLKKYSPEHLVLACDIVYQNDKFYIAIHGWQETSEIQLWDLLDYLLPQGLKYLLCTDISRDGMLCGPNFALYSSILKKHPELCIQASGGITSLADLKKLKLSGMYAAILGKTLYEGKLELKDVSTMVNDHF